MTAIEERAAPLAASPHDTALEIESVHTTILDIPLRRPHKFSVLTIDTQSVLLVRIMTRGGIVGVGEGVVPGGPWWGGESIEGMKALVDGYLAPLLIGRSCEQVGALERTLNALVSRGAFAKAAVEMAMWDVCGKAAGLPLHRLLGGAHRDRLPVTWALGAEPADRLVDEAVERMEVGHHVSFKLKMGATAAADDVARVLQVTEALGDRATFSVDLNGAWNERTAQTWLPALDAGGVDVVEQPVPAWNLDAMARLRDLVQHTSIMADESLQSFDDAGRVAGAHAADVFSLKLAKSGGVLAVQRMGVVADLHGIVCFGGTTIESSIGTAAAAHVYCATAGLTAGSELFGPLLLADDLVVDPVRYEGGDLLLGTDPGLGITIDEDKVARYERRS